MKNGNAAMRAYGRGSPKGTPPIKATEADVARFMSYVDQLPNGCWYWMGGRSKGNGNNKTYGSFWVDGRTVRAHRFAAEVLGGQTCPPGHHRDHKCGFSMCVNPAHLETVTSDENQKRKMRRAREKAQ
jgi:hypothetical protein